MRHHPSDDEKSMMEFHGDRLQIRGPWWIVLSILVLAGPIRAQQAEGGAAPPTPEAEPADAWHLTLEEAVALARRNNPAYLQTRQQVSAADWGVRESYASLLPSVTSSLGMQYTGAGNQLIGTFTSAELGGASTDSYLSSYALSLNYSLSGSTFFGLASSRADRRAAEAGFTAAGFDLEARVTAAYLTALRARDGTEVARTQLERTRESLELAEARFAAGGVPGTDLRQAEVEAGRAEVELVRAENAERVSRLALLEEVGVSSDRPLVLASDLEVFEPEMEVDALVSRALDANPRLAAFREAERARQANVRAAQSSYLPTLSAYLTYAGYARELGNQSYLLGRARSSVESQRENCMFWNQVNDGLTSPLDGYPRDCSGYTLTPDAEAELLARNDAFPFSFQDQPLSAGLRISFPIFQGFRRQRQVEEAEVQARTAFENRRAEELAVRTQVATSLGNLQAAHRVLEIEERNRELAAEQLDLARQRYELGAAPFMELLEAQTSVATAERDYLNAVYDFHGARTELERATGLELERAGEPAPSDGN